MTKCPVCGRGVEPGAVECPLCGEELCVPETVAPGRILVDRPGPSSMPPDTAGPLGKSTGAGVYERLPPPPTSRRQLSSNAVIAAAVAALLIIGGVGYYLVSRHPRSDPGGSGLPWSSPPNQGGTTSSTFTDATPSDSPSSTTLGYPSLTLTGYECERSGTGPYAAVASANDHTSCSFAANVRSEYVQAGANGATVSIDVYSPMTNTWYTMQCSGDQPVMCTGGNDAVVYLYGGFATFT